MAEMMLSTMNRFPGFQYNVSILLRDRDLRPHISISSANHLLFYYNLLYILLFIDYAEAAYMQT